MEISLDKKSIDNAEAGKATEFKKEVSDALDKKAGDAISKQVQNIDDVYSKRQ